MHIALTGPTSPEDIWLAFEPTSFHEGEVHFKAQEAFLIHDKSELLVRSVLAERGFTKTFFLKVSTRSDGLQIGIENIGNPDRTDALKRWLGLVAWSILQAEPEMAVAQDGGLASFIHGPTEG